MFETLWNECRKKLFWVYHFTSPEANLTCLMSMKIKCNCLEHHDYAIQKYICLQNRHLKLPHLVLWMQQASFFLLGWALAGCWSTTKWIGFNFCRGSCTLYIDCCFCIWGSSISIGLNNNRCTTSSWCLCICLSTWLGIFLSTLSKTYQPPLMTRNSKANLGKHWFFLCCSIDISYWHTKHREEAPGKGFKEG